MKITYKQLQALDACDNQLELFQSLFGEEVEVTRELIMKHADKFDWNWAAEKLLPRKRWAEYKRVKAQALAEYKRVKAQALAEYERVKDQAWAEYRIKCAPIFANCAGLV